MGCHVYSCSCAVNQTNHNIYSVIGLKNGSNTPGEEEINDEDDEDNDIAEVER